MAQDIYGNISTVQHEMSKVKWQGSCPAEVHNFGMIPSDQEMIVSSIPGDMDEQPGRLAPQGAGQRKTHCYLYILVTICLVLLITGVCAGTVMLENISSQAEKNTEDLLQVVQNIVENISSQAQKNKEDLRLNIQNVVERISSNEEKNKEDLLQNTQNVGENIKSKIEEQTGNLRNIWQLGFDQISNWKRFGSKLYYFSQSSATWEKAREQCVAMGVSLAMVKTQEEMEFLKKESTRRYWLGLNDLSSEGTWKWLDGTIPDTRLWNPGEPNDLFGEDCGEIDGQLNDVPCDMKKAWICEKSLVI